LTDKKLLVKMTKETFKTILILMCQEKISCRLS